jgi:metal-sulfur cluster biosynthetic enzyme
MIELTTREDLLEALHDVEDPETGLNIVDLGLIYDASFDPQNGRVRVLMTFTTPACPAGGIMSDGIERRLGLLPGVSGVDVLVTFHPPWTPERISPAGRVQLGWQGGSP